MGPIGRLIATIRGGWSVQEILAESPASSAIQEVREGLKNGVEFSGTDAHLADFIRHADSGNNNGDADLESAMYASATNGFNAQAALITWDRLQDEIE